MLPFDAPAALYLNELRWQHFQTLDLPVSGLRVLELGAGVGHFTKRLLAADAQVTALEGRRENVLELIARLDTPEWAAKPWDCYQLDLDDGASWLSMAQGGPYDLCFCYGLLYHLRWPAGLLQFLGSKGMAVPVLALETIVHPHFGLGQEFGGADAALHDQVLIPDRKMLELWLQDNWPYVYHPAPPDYLEYPKTWPMTTDWGRVVYVASMEPIAHLEGALI